MDLYRINMGLNLLIVALLFLVTWRLHRWREARLSRLVDEHMRNYPLPPLGRAMRGVYKDELTPEQERRLWQLDRRFLRQRRATMLQFLVLNFATTLIAAVPLLISFSNLRNNNEHQALNFNLVALATLVVTKGGLLLLTVVVIPFLKAVPVGAGTAVGGLLVQRARKRVGETSKTEPGT